MQDRCEIPGDSQIPDTIAAWTREHVGASTIMVVRTRSPHHCFEYHLVPVDLLESGELRVRGHGTFGSGGEPGPQCAPDSRLLIPLSDVVESAICGAVWIEGRCMQQHRYILPGETDLALTLNLQAETRSQPHRCA